MAFLDVTHKKIAQLAASLPLHSAGTLYRDRHPGVTIQRVNLEITPNMGLCFIFQKSIGDKINGWYTRGTVSFIT